MSYNNNWVKTLSESYVNNNRPTNLDEQLQEQVALNEELLGVIEALCEELGIDMEELFEDVQTDERAQEMEDEIQRTTGKRQKYLMRRDVKEKESRARFHKGGGKSAGVGRSEYLGGNREEDRDDIEKTDAARYAQERNATTDSKEAHAQAAAAQERRKQAGMKPRDGFTPAQRAADERRFSLEKGLRTAVERQQEKDSGVKPSLGKRISRAVSRMTGSSRMPKDYRVLSKGAAEEKAQSRGDTTARRTTTGRDQRNW